MRDNGRVMLTGLVTAASLFAVAAFASADAELRADTWTRVSEGHRRQSAGAVWVEAPDLGRMLLVGSGVEAFDPASMQWETFCDTRAAGKKDIMPFYKGAYVPDTKTLYCLSPVKQYADIMICNYVLLSLNCTDKKWTRQRPAALADLSYLTMAYDPVGKQLVVVGSDKRTTNVGWTRTVLYDIRTGTWSDLPLPGADVVETHKELVAATERTIDLGGHIRSAWYRDPAGKGTAEERAACVALLVEVQGMPGAEVARDDLKQAAALMKSGDLLKALKAVRAGQRTLEDESFRQYPVPCSRRNSPLVYDPKNRVFVLFGGDHEDYHMNDTWVLDPAKNAWKRVSPAVAPSPRAGHALCSLPRSGKVAMYGGYVRYTHMSYGCKPSVPLDPRQLWTYDAATNTWELLKAWPAGKGAAAPNPGWFFGYCADYYNPPLMLADGNDALFVAQGGSKRAKAVTWALAVDTAAADTAGTAKYGRDPNTRLYKTGNWVASFGEVDAVPKPTGLDKLPANKWVRLPMPPRNFCGGGRQRDWGTHVWDSDRDQILLWGGGHCVAGGSPVAHYSPVTGRMVEGYDADESYSKFGRGLYDSSIMNRPWISGHNYNHYAYDTTSGLMVCVRGYLYDPDRMDWLRIPRIKAPFRFKMLGTVAEATAHGVVAWSPKAKGRGYGLWRFDAEKRQWVDLEPKGTVPGLYADSEGACYDSRRDRFLFGFGGRDGRRKGTPRISRLACFDFKTKVIENLKPENTDLAVMGGVREMVYVPDADIVLFGSAPYHVGGGAKGRTLTHVYDCGKNRYMLLDAGPVTYGHSSGWMYDPKRKNVYAIDCHGTCWALHVDAATLTLLDKAPER